MNTNNIMNNPHQYGNVSTKHTQSAYTFPMQVRDNAISYKRLIVCLLREEIFKYSDSIKDL